MTEERWNRLKEVTWFSTEQEEVIKYVDSLRSEIKPHDLIDELLIIHKKLMGFVVD